jgi:hypothetical protein
MGSGLALFKEEALNARVLLLESYNLILEEEPLRLVGAIPLLDDQGKIIDSYKVQIIPESNYPESFPLVYELNGRLPYNIDWHIYPDGHFCIKAFPEEIIICKNGISLVSFIKDQVIPFLFNQKFREEYGYFLKERSHGTEGNLEFFKDVFKLTDLSKIKKHLEFILKRRNPNRVALCFCGSGIKYRKCHREAYQLLSSLPDDILSMYIRVIELYK